MRFFITFLVFTFIPLFLWAFVIETPPPLKLQKNTPVLEYKIIGLKKTHPQVILEEITTPLNSPLKDFNQEELMQKLKEKNLFEKINFFYQLKEGGVVIEIVLKEKTTLLLVPFFAGSSYAMSGGLFLIESNFLGLHKQLVLGGIYSSKGVMGQVIYIDPNFLQSPFLLHTAFFYRQSLIENALLKEGVCQKYKTHSYYFYMREGIKFYKYFTFSFVQRLTFINPYDITLGPYLPSQKAFLVGGQWQYQNLYFQDFTHWGTQVTFDVEHAFKEKEHNPWQEAKIQAKQMFSIFGNHIFALQFMGEYAFNKPILFSRKIGGVMGFKTLPKEIIASNQYFSFLASWELPIIHFNWGVFTAIGFYEVGRFKDILGHWQNFKGPGMGFRVYLKKVAFPAVGMDVAFNQDIKKFYFSVSMGISR